jgi:hypothetical protein
MGPNAFESVIVGYDIDGDHFRHLHFERNMEYGDIGSAEKFEPPRLLGCNNIVYMVTRQVNLHAKKNKQTNKQTNNEFSSWVEGSQEQSQLLLLKGWLTWERTETFLVFRG